MICINASEVCDDIRLILHASFPVHGGAEIPELSGFTCAGAGSLVWVIWWVGLAYVAALLGNLWQLVNPWRIQFQWAESWLGLADRKLHDYPTWLGTWPAVVFFFVFAWLELVSDAGEMPAQLSGLILAYSLVTWAGMHAYGRETWLARAEAFSVCFGLLSRFAITEATTGRESGRPCGCAPRPSDSWWTVRSPRHS